MREPGDSACPAREVLREAVTQLPWLAPSAHSLVAFCRPFSSTTWVRLCSDPGAVLLLLRHLAIYPGGDETIPWPARVLRPLQDPGLIEFILNRLQQSPCGTANWSQEPGRIVLRCSLVCARLARFLARHVSPCPPEQAWVGGLLAPLGWLALCSVNPAAVNAALVSTGNFQEQRLQQGAVWGITHPALARRLARAWGLPVWLVSLVGHLDLPEAVIRGLGTDGYLVHLTRVAIDLARDRGFDLGLVDPVQARESAAALNLPAGLLEGDWVRSECEQALATETGWQDPYQQPLLPELLAVTAENARLRAGPRRERLEEEIDQLQQALQERVHTEAERLQTAKLEALAEFAAGAGHEINNPLAVISGQAQYLLGHDVTWFAEQAQPEVRKSLQAIIAQTRRVHNLLRDLMQFARPTAPSTRVVDLPGLLGETISAAKELAEQRRVRIELHVPIDRLTVSIDSDQVRVALGCLVRNAIEAAPAEGWTRIVLRPPVPGRLLEVVVEDNGPGPDPVHKPHLFDPFFSGRNAGRGRGLGLPIAWRLARLQGGDVCLEPGAPGQPTRFVLRLPWTEGETATIRLAS